MIGMKSLSSFDTWFAIKDTILFEIYSVSVSPLELRMLFFTYKWHWYKPDTNRRNSDFISERSRSTKTPFFFLKCSTGTSCWIKKKANIIMFQFQMLMKMEMQSCGRSSRWGLKLPLYCIYFLTLKKQKQKKNNTQTVNSFNVISVIESSFCCLCQQCDLWVSWRLHWGDYFSSIAASIWLFCSSVMVVLLPFATHSGVVGWPQAWPHCAMQRSCFLSNRHNLALLTSAVISLQNICCPFNPRRRRACFEDGSVLLMVVLDSAGLICWICHYEFKYSSN